MNVNLFRKSSIDRVNSPEKLNEHIRVTNPSVWLILSAIVILLVGVIVWGIFGSIETNVETCAISEGNSVYCIVTKEQKEWIEEGMQITVEGKTGTVTKVQSSPKQLDESMDDLVLYLTGFSKGDFYYMVNIQIEGLENGVFPAVIAVERIHPISFVIR